MTTALSAPRPTSKHLLQVYQLEQASAAITSLEEACGGRGPLMSALLAGTPSASLSYVVGLIADPRNDARALATICAENGVSVGELIEAYKSGVMARAQVAAIKAVAERLPAVVEDTMNRAAPHWVPCRPCRATGTLTPEPTKAEPNPKPGPCDTCAGEGQLLIYPDLDRQKFAIGLGGMSPKVANAPLVDLSDRRSLSVITAGGGGMANIVAAVDNLLYRRRSPDGDLRTAEDADVASDVQEAEVVDAEGAEDRLDARPPRVPVLPPPGRRRS